jgi:hypothetical protein
MAYAAGIDPSSFFTGAEGLVRNGPVGLAALMLVLVIIVLLLRRPHPSQERVLKVCLFVGAFCFVAALIAQALAPPPPPPPPPPDYSKQREILSNVVKTVDPSVEKLTEISRMALALGCPGDGQGTQSRYGGDIASRSSNVMANLANAKSSIEAVIHSLPGGN